MNKDTLLYLFLNHHHPKHTITILLIKYFLHSINKYSNYYNHVDCRKVSCLEIWYNYKVLALCVKFQLKLSGVASLTYLKRQRADGNWLKREIFSLEHSRNGGKVNVFKNLRYNQWAATGNEAGETLRAGSRFVVLP